MDDSLEGAGISKYGSKTNNVESKSLTSSVTEVDSVDEEIKNDDKNEVLRQNMGYQKIKEKCLSDSGQVSLENFRSLKSDRRKKIVERKVRNSDGIKRLEICHDFFLPNNLGADSKHYSEVVRILRSLNNKGIIDRETRNGNIFYSVSNRQNTYEEEVDEVPEPETKKLSELTGEDSDRCGLYICTVGDCDFKSKSGREARVHKSKKGHNSWLKRLSLPDGWDHPSKKACE